MRKTATIALMRHGGSHYIRPIVDQLGFDIIEPGNFGAPLDKSVGPVIVFTRNPQNRMASTFRWWRDKPRKAAILDEAGPSNDDQMLYLLNQEGFLNEMLGWARVWCWWPRDHLRIRFEDRSIEQVEMISSHLGFSPYRERDEQIFNNVHEKGRTFTGTYSNWKDYFGPKSIHYWDTHGGVELITLMGYDNAN